MLTVSQQDSRQVMVQVPPGPLQKILQGPPDQLHRSSGMMFVGGFSVGKVLSLIINTTILLAQGGSCW